MSATSITKDLISFIEDQIDNLVLWEGEIPRRNESAVELDDSQFPSYLIEMQESGFQREWTMEDTYTDTGSITIHIFSTTKNQAKQKLDEIEQLLNQEKHWRNVMSDPDELIQFLAESWYLGQMREIRTKQRNFIYTARMVFNAIIRSNTPTD